MPRMPASRGYQPGFSVIAPAPTPRIVQGPSTGAAVERLGESIGRIGEGIAQGQIRDERAASQLADRQEAIARSEVEAEEREVAQERRRVGRLRAANAAVELELGIDATRAELDEQLARGGLKPDQYEAKLQEAIGKQQGALREGIDPDMQVDFDMAARRPIRAAQLNARKSLREHGRREAVAELDKGRENLLRVAVGDLPRALAMGSALYDREGPYAKQIGIDQAQKQGQDFREAATRVHFARAVADRQNDPGALAALRKEIGGNTDLDPTQQAALLGQIDSRTSVLENRAQAAVAKRERQQDQAFRALQELDAQGLPLSPAFVERTMSTLRGSPLAEAAAEVVKGAAATAAFGSKSLDEQNRIIAGQFASARETGVDPGSSKRLQKLVGIRNATEAAVRADPWRAASERGLLDEVPSLRLDSLEGLSESLTARMTAAPTVDAFAGRTVSPLQPAEAEGLADTIGALPVQERAKALGMIQAAIGPERMRAVAEQMKAKDGTLGIAAAYQAGGMKTEGGQDLGALVLRGAEARKSKLVKDSGAEWDQVEQTVVKALDGAYATPAATRAAVEATMNVYAGLAADGRRASADAAIKAATGGVTEHNGQKIPIPYGWDARRVKRSIEAITPEHIRSQMGAAEALFVGTRHPLLPEDVAAAIPKAQLRSAGPNRYAIRIGDQLLTIDGRRPFTITLPDAP
jgi:hypothetical protein